MDFPSGPWTGFYNYGNSAKKHRMDLVLTFANHIISGDGRDDLGLFVIAGRFDDTNGECYWTKTYVGAHDVYYRGFREGKGIWGLWELRSESGGFHIWPLGEEEGEHEHETLEEPAPVEAVAAHVRNNQVELPHFGDLLWLDLITSRGIDCGSWSSVLRRIYYRVRVLLKRSQRHWAPYICRCRFKSARCGDERVD